MVGAPHACTAHALWDQLCFVRRHFPHAIVNGQFAEDFPLSPTEDGGGLLQDGHGGHVPSRSGLAGGTFRVGGRLLGHHGTLTECHWRPRALSAWAGTMGHPAYRPLGSEAVKAYVREVPLEAALLMAAQASGAGGLTSVWVPRGLDLADLLAGRAAVPSVAAAPSTTEAVRWAPYGGGCSRTPGH